MPESFNSNLAHEQNFVFWQCSKVLFSPNPVLTVSMILRFEVIAKVHGDKHEILFNYSEMVCCIAFLSCMTDTKG
jgi:hypothetical protein